MTVGHDGPEQQNQDGRAPYCRRYRLHCVAFPAHGACRAALPLRGPSRSKRTATNVTASKIRRAYSFEQTVPIYRRD
jgi:hypothetical protein